MQFGQKFIKWCHVLLSATVKEIHRQQPCHFKMLKGSSPSQHKFLIPKLARAQVYHAWIPRVLWKSMLCNAFIL